jgi:hypothetical protein
MELAKLRAQESGQLRLVNSACERKALVQASRGLGAHARIRTGDLFLTKEMLCHLSYVGESQPKITKAPRSASPCRLGSPPGRGS